MHVQLFHTAYDTFRVKLDSWSGIPSHYSPQAAVGLTAAFSLKVVGQQGSM
jgi:hypothetical protein